MPGPLACPAPRLPDARARGRRVDRPLLVPLPLACRVARAPGAPGCRASGDRGRRWFTPDAPYPSLLTPSRFCAVPPGTPNLVRFEGCSCPAPAWHLLGTCLARGRRLSGIGFLACRAPGCRAPGAAGCRSSGFRGPVAGLSVYGGVWFPREIGLPFRFDVSVNPS